MKSPFVVLCICLVFVPIWNAVHGNVFGDLGERLNKNGAKINEVLEILSANYLGKGGYGLVYRGIRINDKRPVAVKFIPSSFNHSAEREYTIYTYLHAIDNPSIERYGIPAVYYYGKWEKFIVMAITLCEGSLNDRKVYFNSTLNALIIFQQFVRQSKYLHSLGIRHDDIKPDNILLRKYQSFLIDYNLGSKMNADTRVCTYKYAPRRLYFSDQNRKAIDDWESFFYAMAKICDVPLKWFSGAEYLGLPEYELNRKYGEAKIDVEDIRNKIEAIKSISLRKVFVAFFREIFSKNAKDFPEYDWMDLFIAFQIQSELTPNQPIFFTWMNSQDITEALEHIRMNPIPNIYTDITDPRQFKFNYPPVNFNYFNATTSAGSSGHH